jgi:hypothetical protein
LEAALECPDDPTDVPAAIAHHSGGYPEWVVDHADRIYGVGCNLGPGAIFLQYSPYGPDVKHALAALRDFGPVCVIDHGLFDGRALDKGQLGDLCSKVGGKIVFN